MNILAACRQSDGCMMYPLESRGRVKHLLLMRPCPTSSHSEQGTGGLMHLSLWRLASWASRPEHPGGLGALGTSAERGQLQLTVRP